MNFFLQRKFCIPLIVSGITGGKLTFKVTYHIYKNTKLCVSFPDKLSENLCLKNLTFLFELEKIVHYVITNQPQK